MISAFEPCFASKKSCALGDNFFALWEAYGKDNYDSTEVPTDVPTEVP